jgi:hypothetical protein
MVHSTAVGQLRIYTPGGRDGRQSNLSEIVWMVWLLKAKHVEACICECELTCAVDSRYRSEFEALGDDEAKLYTENDMARGRKSRRLECFQRDARERSPIQQR